MVNQLINKGFERQFRGRTSSTRWVSVSVSKVVDSKARSSYWVKLKSVRESNMDLLIANPGSNRSNKGCFQANRGVVNSICNSCNGMGRSVGERVGVGEASP